MASSSVNRYTPASSPVAIPTIKRSSAGSLSSRSTCESWAGPILEAHPAQRTEVRQTGSLVRHGFLLLGRDMFQGLRDRIQLRFFQSTRIEEYRIIFDTTEDRGTVHPECCANLID